MKQFQRRPETSCYFNETARQVADNCSTWMRPLRSLRDAMPPVVFANVINTRAPDEATLRRVVITAIATFSAHPRRNRPRHAHANRRLKLLELYTGWPPKKSGAREPFFNRGLKVKKFYHGYGMRWFSLWHLSDISAICNLWPQLQILWAGVSWAPEPVSPSPCKKLRHSPIMIKNRLHERQLNVTF